MNIVEDPPQLTQQADPFPKQVATVLCAILLTASFFAPWAVGLDGQSVTPFMIAQQRAVWVLWAIPLFAVLTSVSFRAPRLRGALGIVTPLATVVCIVHLRMNAPELLLRDFLWGQYAAAFLALVLFGVSGRDSSTTALDLVARRLNSRDAEVYEHWGVVEPGGVFGTQAFYRILEDAIGARHWPGVSVQRIDYSEAGLLSHKRQYLRIIRHRQVFDICCASYGVDGFFSVREAEIPSTLDWRVVVVVLVCLGSLTLFSMQVAGLFLGPFLLLGLLVLLGWFLLNILRMGLSSVDSLLVKLPILGPVYEKFFRRDTYFQQDSRIIFRQMVDGLVREVIDRTASTQGLKLLRTFERRPVLGALYRKRIRTLPTMPEAKAA